MKLLHIKIWISHFSWKINQLYIDSTFSHFPYFVEHFLSGSKNWRTVKIMSTQTLAGSQDPPDTAGPFFSALGFLLVQ